MKLVTLTVLIGVVLFVAVSTPAQEQRNKNPCEKAYESGVTADLVECSSKKLTAADADLNKTYRQLVSKMGDKKWELKLRSVQQAWIKFRDANCDYMSEFSGGGSAATWEYNFCLADMTTIRTKELREMLQQIKERDGR